MSIEQIAALTRRYRELAGVAAGIAEEQDAIKAKILTLMAPGESHDVDGEPVRVQPPNRKFDDGVAAKILWERNPAALTACEVRTWDAKKLKAALTGDELEACMLRASGANPSVRWS